MRALCLLSALCCACTAGTAGDDVGAAPDVGAGLPDVGAADDGVDVSTGLPDFGPVGGDRPANVVVPSDWSASARYPVVVLLHGLGANSTQQNILFRASTLVDELDFVLVLPEGTTDSSGRQFWNATEYCCDWDQTGVDDSTYLIELADEVITKYGGDPSRLYFMGHSNGGYMSYRMACDHSDRIAGIASLAGSSYVDPAACGSPEPISVLQIHGTDDNTVGYYGGMYEGLTVVIGAEELVERWVVRNGCDEESVFVGASDYDSASSGDETVKGAWRSCDAGTEVQLWTMNGSGHIPSISVEMTRDLLAFLFRFAKP